MTGSAARRSARTKPTAQDDGQDPEQVDRERVPGEGVAAERGEQDQADRRRADQRGARIVDHMAGLAQPAGQHRRGHHQGNDADREVDVENPPPGQVVHEEAADQRAEHAGDPERGAEDPLITAALARRDDVTDDGLRAHDQAAAAQSLDGAERDQLDHRVRQAGQRRTDQEDHDRRLEEHLPAVHVAELAPQRRRHRGGEQVGRDDPGQVRQPVKIACDGRQRRRDDRLVERGQQHSEQQRTDDYQHPPLAYGLRPIGHCRGFGLNGHATFTSPPASPGAVSRGAPFGPSTVLGPIVA